MPLIWGTSRQIPSFLETLNPAPGWGSLIRRQIGRSCQNWPKTTSGRGDGRWAGVYSRCGDNWGDWGGHCGLWWTIASVDCGGHCCRQCGGHCGLWWTHFGHFCLDRRSSRQVWWGRLGILSIGNLQNDASEIYAEGSNQAEKFIYFPDLNRNIWDDESNRGAKLPNSQTEVSEDCSKLDSANTCSDLCCFIRLLKCICCDLFQIIRFCK